MIFFIGLHQPSDARHFGRCCISINRLRNRKSSFASGEILVDSGAFTEISTHGAYRTSVSDYAEILLRLTDLVPILAAVSQDYMCEPFILAKTGLSVQRHQCLTIERYQYLRAFLPENFPILPVLQGYEPRDYARHALAYGDLLSDGMWVGVGSICKRNVAPEEIVGVLHAVKSVRPDLRLHGFGVKKTALLHPGIREMLYSADSMAWSFAARKAGRDPNSWHEAEAFRQQVETVALKSFQPWQRPLLFT